MQIKDHLHCLVARFSLDVWMNPNSEDWAWLQAELMNEAVDSLLYYNFILFYYDYISP